MSVAIRVSYPKKKYVHELERKTTPLHSSLCTHVGNSKYAFALENLQLPTSKNQSLQQTP